MDYVFAAALLGGLAVAAEWVLRGEDRGGTAYVVDGDTLALNGEHIRIEGIDAPELHQDCARANGRLWPCGEVAREAMADLVAGGEVTCSSSARDDYDRPLAHCRVGGRDLGAQMVAKGYAIAFRSGEYRGEEAEAKREKRGIWDGSFQRPVEFRAEHPRTDRPR